MSLTTLLLALAPAIFRPKPAPEKSAREEELEGEIEALAAKLELAWVERDSWRRRYEDAAAMMARVIGDRIEQRAQYQDGLLALQTAQARQMAPLTQLQAQQAMQAMLNSYQYQAQQNANPFCNCVPARHDMLLGAIGGA